MQHIGIATLLVALAFGAHASFADDAAGLEPPEILSREETEARMGRLFHIIDVNGDGLVDNNEMETFNRDNLQKIQGIQLEHEMEMIDTNKDGFIEFQELSENFPPESGSYESFVDGLTRRFEVADKNKDGKLNKEELYVMLNPARDEAMLQLEVREIMQAHDKNGDGLISIAEYTASKTDNDDVGEFLESEFKPFDLNNDGFLSEAELVSAFMEEAKEDYETNLEDVHAIIGEGPVDRDTWMKHAMELSTSSITDHGELLRFPSDYNINLEDDARKRKEEEFLNEYVGAEL
ncbi:hypothetical protein BgAZ_103700 [Babesia gibsoni]|uniref:EF-hand domain-containing protein n=1 Tax=Babesia gibsoni TaxID=33632 RepID=A0AAD8UVP8_BABGI|nr:hypothetical protein BgAZ_103700 [Babesia gibsoni]